jgi:hypothetical protein
MEDITSLVVQTINDKLPDIPVYREKIPTAFSEPSFAVTRIGVLSKGGPSAYDMRTYSFDVAYFPDPIRPREDIDNMAEWFMANLKTIEPNYAVVINSELKVVDDILHYTFDVRAHVRDDFEPLLKKPLTYSGGLKNG